MINNIRAKPSDDPFKRGQSKKVGGASNNNEKVEKTREVDPEEQRKKFQQHLEEKADLKENGEVKIKKVPSPYETSFFDSKTYDKENPIQKNSFDKALEEESNVPYFQKPEDKEQDPIENDKPKEFSEKKNKKIRQKEYISTGSKTEFKDEKSDDEKNIEKKTQPSYIPAGPIDVPFETMQKAAEITENLKVSLNSEIAPLFEQMVGKFLIMSTKEGIMQTELTLDNPEMENSLFYGSKITLEKYSTAPDSFNITLTGTPEAVELFNDNIQALMAVFHRGDFNFRVNNIAASLEVKESEHIFRRKKKPMGDQTGGSLGK